MDKATFSRQLKSMWPFVEWEECEVSNCLNSYYFLLKEMFPHFKALGQKGAFIRTIENNIKPLPDLCPEWPGQGIFPLLWGLPGGWKAGLQSQPGSGHVSGGAA